MKETIAKIERTMLGWEDHGILTCMLTVSYGGGSAQGIGGYTLDEPVRDGQNNFVGRRGTDYGMEFVARMIQACGVQTWEEVKGRTILVLHEDDRWHSPVIGIKPLPTEGGKEFIFDDLKELIDS